MKFCDMMACASCGNALCSLSGFASHCLVREMDHGMQRMQAEHNIENTSRQTQYKTMSHILYRPHEKNHFIPFQFNLEIIENIENGSKNPEIQTNLPPPPQKKKSGVLKACRWNPVCLFFFRPWRGRPRTFIRGIDFAHVVGKSCHECSGLVEQSGLFGDIWCFQRNLLTCSPRQLRKMIIDLKKTNAIPLLKLT